MSIWRMSLTDNPRLRWPFSGVVTLPTTGGPHPLTRRVSLPASGLHHMASCPHVRTPQKVDPAPRTYAECQHSWGAGAGH